MKKLLFLGGIMQQIPAIKRARELGYYVITADYKPDNPGHRFSDEYYNVSTTDLGGVLALAKEKKIDGIVAYASDPAAPTAAYVAEKLCLPGNPYESVKLLTEKDLFRDFLAAHGFNCPWHHNFASKSDALSVMVGRCVPTPPPDWIADFPYMIKPVDSSGSKGVVKVTAADQIPAALDEAFSYSRSGRIVIEKFIVKKGYQVSGDGFSIDGELVFTSYGNELYSGNGTRDYVALGEFWPTFLTSDQKAKVDAELQRLITALGMRTCAYNIEVILDKDDNVYILELAPRNGGSYIPQLIRYATGVDLVTPTIQAALGDLDPAALRPSTFNLQPSTCFSNYMLYSTVSGRFKRLVFDPDFERNNLLEVHCTASPGDEIHAYRNTSHSLGTILFKTASLDEMLTITADLSKYYHVEVE